jgi:hypothetical protein
MSLMQQVVDIVRARGQTDVDEIQIEGFSREQVMKAMSNAVQRGLVRSVGVRGRPGRSAGRMPDTYAAMEPPPEKQPSERELPPRGKLGHMGRVSSVFALGQQ